MIVLGLDPGLERVGYGVIRRDGSRLIPIDHGLIETPRIELPLRLAMLHEQVCELVDRTKPDAFATEKLLFSVNRRTAMDVPAWATIADTSDRRRVPAEQGHHDPTSGTVPINRRWSIS